MKIKKIKEIIAILSLVLVTFINVGLGNFSIGGTTKAENLQINNGNSAVCYIDGTSPTYFTSIEKALEVAGNNSIPDTIYVIPNNLSKNVTINRNCKIEKLDTLILPYEEKIWDFRNGPTILKNRFADDCEAMVSLNRKTLVTIKKGVTLIVEGTLNIGGVLGNASVGYQGLQGQTSGFYSEILMEVGDRNASGAKILVNNGGTVDCRGYIKQNIVSNNINYQPQFYLKSGTHLKIPFVIYDFQGATATGAIYCGEESIKLTQIGQEIKFKGQACPFALFDLPNIQILSTISAGSEVKGLISLHTSAQTIAEIIDFKESWNTDEFTLIGSTNSLLYINTGFIRIKYNPKNIEFTEVLNYAGDKTRTIVDFFGDCSFGAMKMTLNAQIAKVVIDTSEIFFPFSYRWGFNIKKGGNLEIGNGIKFMNGCYLNIDEGGKLTANNGAKIIFYTKNWVDHKTTIPYSPLYTINSENGEVANVENLDTTCNLVVKTTSPNVTGEATFLNNGELILKNGSTFGGFIQTNSVNASLNIESGLTNTVQSLETNGKGGREGLAFVFHQVDPQTIKETGKTNLVNNFDNITSHEIVSGTFEGTSNNAIYGFGTRNGVPYINGDSGVFLNETKTYNIEDSSFCLGDEFIRSCSDETKIKLNSNNGKNITVTGINSGEVTLSCKILYKNEEINTISKKLKAGYYADVNVTVDTTNIYDNKENPFLIGGIGDYRDFNVSIDTNCTDYNLEWEFDSKMLSLTNAEGNTNNIYRFKTIGSGNGILKLNFKSSGLTINDIWSQEITIANNKRITSITINPSLFESNAGAIFNEYQHTASIKTDGNIKELNFEYTKESNEAQVKSITIDGNTITFVFKGRSIAGTKHNSTFVVYSNNGINGAQVKSNELTFKVH